MIIINTECSKLTPLFEMSTLKFKGVLGEWAWSCARERFLWFSGHHVNGRSVVSFRNRFNIALLDPVPDRKSILFLVITFSAERKMEMHVQWEHWADCHIHFRSLYEHAWGVYFSTTWWSMKQRPILEALTRIPQVTERRFWVAGTFNQVWLLFLGVYQLATSSGRHGQHT